MLKRKASCLAAVSVLVLNLTCSWAEELLVKSEFPMSIKLWMWTNKGGGVWESPKPLVQEASTKDVTTRFDGQYYFMAKTLTGDEYHLRWWDLSKIKRERDSKKHIRIGVRTEERQGTRTLCRSVNETVEQPYTVLVPYTETRHDKNGYAYQFRGVRSETRTRSVVVTKQVNEEVPYTFTVSVPYVDVDDVDGEAAVDQPPQTDRLGLKVHRCPTGIHIDAVFQNSPATRCTDSGGRQSSLNVGEHIIQYNGRHVSSIENFLDELKVAETVLSLVVQDGGGGQRTLTLELAPPVP